jgi:tetratricopeptide (TPR) repeat protein
MSDDGKEAMSNIDRASVEALLERSSDATASREDQVGWLGEAIDAAMDLDDAGLLERAATIVERLLVQDSKTWREAALHYFHGNAWGAIRHIQHADLLAAWSWESKAHEREILSLRRCVVHPGFGQLAPRTRARVFTNLGNVLNNTGRFVDALEYYDRALQLAPGFGMAMGNKGVCLLTYAREHYDPGHQCVFAGVAARLLEAALRQPLEAPDAAEGFARHLEIAQGRYRGHSCAEDDALNRDSLGDTEDERLFRRWCLDNRLFVNPLNDLGTVSIGARDFLHLPTLTIKVEHGTSFHGFFNQLKQEYAAARWLVYEADKGDAPGFVDAELNLLDTMDCPVYGIGIEKLRLAMRAAYSLLDKIAVFLARALELADKKPYFRWMWYADRGHTTLLPVFAGRENLALRALFWLSKDLVADRNDESRQLALEPDARDIAAMRNAMEHGYLKVHAEGWCERAIDPDSDPLAYHTTREELRARAMRVLKLVRAALVYLSLAMHREEAIKERTRKGLALSRGSLRPIEASLADDVDQTERT